MASARDLTAYVSSHKKRHRNTMLLLAIVAAFFGMLGLGVAFYNLRAGRAVALLLQDREQQLLTLHMVLEKERARSKEMKTKIEELKAKAVSLRTQKMQLKVKLTEVETQATHLKQKLASLKEAAEEASTKAELLKQQKQQQRPDDAEEGERRLQQPDANATSPMAHDDGGVSSNGNINDQSANSNDQSTTGEGEINKINAADDRGDDHDRTTTTSTDTGTGTGTGGGGDQEGGKYSGKQEEQGSEGGKWERLETNVDDGSHGSADNGDGRSVGGEDRGNEEEKHQVGEVAPEDDQEREVLKGEGTILSQVGDQSRVLGDGEQGQAAAADGTDQLRLNNGITSGSAGTTGVEDAVAIRDGDVVESSNTTEIISTSSTVTAASEEEEGNNNNEGTHEEKQTTVETQISIRGKRSRGRTARSKGRKRKTAAARSSEEQTNSEALLEGSISSRKEISFHHDDDQSSRAAGEIINTDGQLVFDDKNANAATEMANSVPLEQPPNLDQVQTEAADADAEERGRGTTTAVGSELAPVSSTNNDGNNISETRGSTGSTESYPDTNGSGLKGTDDVDDKAGFDGGEQDKISGSTTDTEGSNTSGGARQEDGRPAAETSSEKINIRSATEAAGENLVAAALQAS